MKLNKLYYNHIDLFFWISSLRTQSKNYINIWTNSKYLYSSLTEFAKRISKRINHCDHNAAHK